jgi:hypothetical protein
VGAAWKLRADIPAAGVGCWRLLTAADAALHNFLLLPTGFASAKCKSAADDDDGTGDDSVYGIADADASAAGSSSPQWTPPGSTASMVRGPVGQAAAAVAW